MQFDTLALSPALATVLFCVTCVAGFRYRRAWKTEAPRRIFWIYGLVAAIGLLVLGLVPITISP